MAQFVELLPNRGVDSRPREQAWMMVPAGNNNYIRLVDGAGFDVKPADLKHHIDLAEINRDKWVTVLKELTATVPQGDRLFRVRGVSAGPAQIVARRGRDEIKVEISVKKNKSYSIAYYFIQDAGAKSPRSTFSTAYTDVWIKGLNDVYGLQANLWFSKIKKKAGVFVLPLPQLPEAIGPDQAKVLAQEGSKLDSSADIKIYLAGPKIVSQDASNASHVNGFYHVEQKIIIMKDRISDKGQPMLQTMAHEIGHWFNYNHGPGEGHDFYQKVGYKSDILNTMDGNDIKIPKQRVLNWNGS
jgi:hypothetical protein